MRKITHKSSICKGKVEGSIVDILTDNDVRTSIWQPKEKAVYFPKVIGVNSVCEGRPVKLFYQKGYERGLQDPDSEDFLYLIYADEKIITRVKNDFNLFNDQDKVRDENIYVWHGTFGEILGEFENGGYEIK